MPAACRSWVMPAIGRTHHPVRPRRCRSAPFTPANERNRAQLPERGTEESNLALRFWRPPCYRYTSPPGEAAIVRARGRDASLRRTPARRPVRSRRAPWAARGHQVAPAADAAQLLADAAPRLLHDLQPARAAHEVEAHER